MSHAATAVNAPGTFDERTKETNTLTGHAYDGIQEYDNPTPGWWHMVFFATVVFSIGYLVIWHMSVMGWSIEESWEDDQRAEYARIFGAVGELKPDQDTVMAQMNNPKMMAVAKALFIGNCAACHKRDGGGDVGVNLCDDSYKNVKSIGELFKVITDGANSGAMPAWKNRLSSNERVILSAYVASLRGTTPAVAKPPEGVPIPPWPQAAAKPAGQ